MIAEAERVLATIPEEEQAPLSEVLEQLKQALIAEDTDAIKRAGSRLTDMLFDLKSDL
jgi:DNA-binding GntR family transcriptional regulator